MPWIILIVLVVIVAAGLIGIYNGLVRLKHRCENGWSQIDVQLKRRYDLIPNLVETVKGYAAHEKDTLEKVIKARQMAIDASSVKDQAEAENMITGALRSIFDLSEAYPDLKANQNFMMLQEELAGTEGKIAYARQFYNDTVMKFNQKQETFPSNVVAGMFGFKPRDYFEIEEPEQREAVKVEF